MTYPDTPDARLSAMSRIIDTLTEHADRPVTCGAAPATILPAGVAPTVPMPNQTCLACKGTGRDYEDSRFECPVCRGTGKYRSLAPTEQPHVAQLDRVGNFYFLGCRFESCRAGQNWKGSSVAEQGAHNAQVAGSIPAPFTTSPDTWGSPEIAQITAMTPDQVARLLEGQV